MKNLLLLHLLICIFYLVSCQSGAQKRKINSQKLSSHVLKEMTIHPEYGELDRHWNEPSRFAEDTLIGFSHSVVNENNNLNTPGILIMPASKSLGPVFKCNAKRNSPYAKAIHNSIIENEAYILEFTDELLMKTSQLNGIGIHQYTYSHNSTTPSVLIDLGTSILGQESNNVGNNSSFIKTIGKNQVVGYRSENIGIELSNTFFAIDFSENWIAYQYADGSEVVKATEAKGACMRSMFLFNPQDRKLILKIALSEKSIQDAYDQLAL